MIRFMRCSFPAVDFPLYGLQADWDLPRWLDHVDGRAGEPPVGIWLWHGRQRAPSPWGPWLRVASLPRERHARSMTPAGGDPVREVAFAATFALINATVPAPAERPTDYPQRALNLAQRQADRYSQWKGVTWVVNDERVPALTLDWAGAWTGFTTAVPEVDIVAVGCGIQPTALILTEYADTALYHFDWRLPLEFPDVVEAGRVQALFQVDVAVPGNDSGYWPRHPDHDAVGG
jgi:hypothetical protein